MIEKTLSRPRELIQLARYYTEDVNDSDPSDEKLKSAEPTYSGWKLDDLCAEYSNQYPGLGSIMSYWKTRFRRRKYHLKRVEVDEILLDIMSNVTLDCHWFNQLIDNTDTSEFLRILYEIGLLGDFVLGGREEVELTTRIKNIMNLRLRRFKFTLVSGALSIQLRELETASCDSMPNTSWQRTDRRYLLTTKGY